MKRFALPVLASLMLAGAAIRPLFLFPIFATLTESNTLCSIADCARYDDLTFEESLRLPEPERGPALASAIARGDLPIAKSPLVHGWPELIALAAVAAGSLLVAAVGRGRWLWVPAAALLGLTAWRGIVIYDRVESVVGAIQDYLPGGPEANPITNWLHPVPVILLGAAALLLFVESWRAQGERRRR